MESKPFTHKKVIMVGAATKDALFSKRSDPASFDVEAKAVSMLTDEDKRRIQAAEERRKRRNAKAAKREVG